MWRIPWSRRFRPCLSSHEPYTSLHGADAKGVRPLQPHLAPQSFTAGYCVFVLASAKFSCPMFVALQANASLLAILFKTVLAYISQAATLPTQMSTYKSEFKTTCVTFK